MNNELGARIRTLRKERGLSQEALAQALEVSRQAVTKWEDGSSLPSTANLFALSGGLFRRSARRVDRHAGGCRSPAEHSSHIRKSMCQARKSPAHQCMDSAGYQRTNTHLVRGAAFYCRAIHSRGTGSAQRDYRLR